MVNLAAVKRLEKLAHVDVKPVRVWEMTADGRRPLLKDDPAKYADPDASKYKDMEVHFVTSDGASII